MFERSRQECKPKVINPCQSCQKELSNDKESNCSINEYFSYDFRVMSGDYHKDFSIEYIEKNNFYSTERKQISYYFKIEPELLDDFLNKQQFCSYNCIENLLELLDGPASSNNITGYWDDYYGPTDPWD